MEVCQRAKSVEKVQKVKFCFLGAEQLGESGKIRQCARKNIPDLPLKVAL